MVRIGRFDTQDEGVQRCQTSTVVLSSAGRRRLGRRGFRRPVRGFPRRDAGGAGPVRPDSSSPPTCPTCATASSGWPCRRASSTARSSRAGDRRRRRTSSWTTGRSCPAGTTAWRRSAAGTATVDAGAQPRGERLGLRPSGGRHADVRHVGPRRHLDRARHPSGRGGVLLRQPVRHPDELLRRAMPWGSWMTCEETVNGYDVGDDFTPDAPPTSRTRGCSRHGFIFEVPVDGRATAEPITQRRPLPARVGRVGPEGRRALPQRGQLRVPVRLLQVRPAQNPKRAGRLRDGGQLYMLKVAGGDNADLAVHQADGTRYDVEWVEIDQPSFDFGRPAPDRRRPTNDVALQFVSSQGRARARPSSPVSRARSTTAAGSTSPPPRAGCSGTDPAGHGGRLRQGLGPDLGLPPRRPDAATAVRVAQPGRARLPRQRDHERPRHADRVRGRRDDNFLRGLTRRASSSTSPRTS